MPFPGTGNKINSAIVLCAALFVVVLLIAAYFDPSILVLHVFEALPYLIGAGLCLRRKKFGYMLAGVSGGFWLWTASFLTTFVRNGFERVAMLVRTGAVDRVDILIAAPAAIFAAGLVLFSTLGYARLRNRSSKDLALLVGAIMIVPAFFVLIFAVFAPQYLGMFRGLWRR